MGGPGDWPMLCDTERGTMGQGKQRRREDEGRRKTSASKNEPILRSPDTATATQQSIGFSHLNLMTKQKQ